jgi:hypothetical protein
MEVPCSKEWHTEAIFSVCNMLPVSYRLGRPEPWHVIFTEKTAGFI